MAEKSKATRLRIVSCVAVYTGKNQAGGEFTIHDIEACKETGETIEHKLNSFEDLPVGEVLDVNVTPYTSAEHGRSFTVSRRGRVSTTAQLKELREMVDSLVLRVSDLEARLRPQPEPQPQQQAPTTSPASVAAQSDVDRQFAVE